ncbi:hypothetical protein [Labilibaculum sp.]|uniref:hypothetical protein n=1 Tax=Labilibaculum sp. TaxID=2060723 RepID=UPI002AA71B7C|nr:hypothetical protein [Labilibaculum sp.]
MKKLHVNNIRLFVCFILIILTSCTSEFVPDPIDPRLPKYTEKGNNAAGAYIGDEIWKSEVYISFPSYGNSNRPYIKAWQEQDSLMIVFSGSTKGTQAFVEFHLKGLNISKFDDLIDLNGQKISLDENQNAGYYIENYAPIIYDNKGIGQIYFRNVRFNNDKSAIIISGTFGFSLSEYDQWPLKVSSGRFDYKIFKTDFYQDV